MADATGPIPTSPDVLDPADFTTAYVVEDEAQIWRGIGVGINSEGFLVKASDPDVQYTVGRACDSLLGDGVEELDVEAGIFNFANGINELSIQNRLGPCYWEDDHTVGSNAGTGALAGIVVDVSDAGVLVATGFIPPTTITPAP